MSTLLELTLVSIVLTNLLLAGSSRIASCIRITGFQGMALAFLPLFAPGHGWSIRLVLLAGAVLVVKGMILPRMLTRAMVAADVRHEVEPMVGFSLSVVLSVAFLGALFWMASRFPVIDDGVPTLALPLALSTILTGLFVIISRRKAISQVIGYLVLENGVYIFGLLQAPEVPFLVEMGILLDVFVAVLVMGIAIFHIRKTFDHIDVDRLTSLRD